MTRLVKLLSQILEVLTEIRDDYRKVAYTVPEAALALGVSESTVRKLVASGQLRKVPFLGERVIIARSELLRFIGARTSERSAA